MRNFGLVSDSDVCMVMVVGAERMGQAVCVYCFCGNREADCEVEQGSTDQSEI